ncbi:uncharacterized protein [Tenebrio molitor]|uniref:uncharacterized protein isoform X8 n=1 Tax=Tenebrio molitor TaxID=7067 RepID=UPI0036247018
MNTQREKMLFWLIIYCYLLVKLMSAEVITLIKDSNVTCLITENSVAYYSTSPDITVNRQSSDINVTWIYDDWRNIHSKNSSHGPVTDRRWKGFTKGKFDGFIMNNNVRCFSIYADGGNVTLEFTSGDLKQDIKSLNIKDDDSIDENIRKSSFHWLHYALIRKNNSVNISTNGNVIQTIHLDFVPRSLVIYSNYLKFHDYYFKYSDTITTTKNFSSYLIFDTPKNMCLSFFTSVDKNCYLDVIVNVNKINVFNQTVKGFNEDNLLKSWKEIEIKTNLIGKGEIIFFRRRLDNNTTGYWAIDDIRFCNKNIEIISTDFSHKSDNKVLCKNLNAEYKPGVNMFCNKTGYLGKNCSVSCEQLLGKSYSNCENYTVCLENEFCYCASGYTGASCERTCNPGYWGINCSSLCSSACEICDQTNHCTKCKSKFFGEECSEQLPVVLEPPKLNFITDESVTIEISNLKCSDDEAKPDHYQIQYKQVDEKIYKNFSDPELVTLSTTYRSHIYRISNLTTKTHAYNIRVILMVQNKSFTVDIPELTTFRKTLQATMDDSSLLLRWTGIEEGRSFNYSINHNCTGKFYSNEIMINYTSTNEITTRIENKLTLQTCEIQLWVRIRNSTELIDSILIVPSKLPEATTTDHDFPKAEPESKESARVVVPELKNSTSLESSTVEVPLTSENMDKIFKKYGTHYNQITLTSKLKTTLKGVIGKRHIQHHEVKSSLTNKSILFLISGLILTLAIIISLSSIYYHYALRKGDAQETVMLEEIVPITSEHDQTHNTNIKVADFEDAVRKIIFTNILENELHSIPHTATTTCHIGLESKNINRNKDRFHIPYDCTRVILRPLPGLGTHDYINASYINGYDKPKAYIACQGPKFYTVKDFWRLIWQENVETIVMATNLLENKKRMCAEYWPQKVNALYECGNMTIKLIKEENFEYHDIRVLEICYDIYTRKIEHLHLKWHSSDEIPFYPNDLIPVVKHIRKITENSEVPIVIHSGFGVNRTGTLILCDLALAMANSTNEVNIYNLTRKLREQRPRMVNKTKNYLLVHLVVLEVFVEMENPFKKRIQENLDKNIIKQQLGYLNRLCWNDRVIESPMSQCATTSRLHPSFVDGYGTRKNFIIIQQPNEQTVAKFWKLIVTEEVTHILFLKKVNKKISLWPHRNVGSTGIILVRFLEETRKSYGTINYLHVRRFNKTTGQKSLHGRYFKELEQPEINIQASQHGLRNQIFTLRWRVLYLRYKIVL